MSTSRYIVAILLVAGLPPGLLWWFVVHPFVGFWRRLGAGMTMTVMLIYMFGTLGALYTIRETLMGADLGTSPPLVVVGLLLMGAGAYVSFKRRTYLTAWILAGGPEVHADEEKRGKLLDEGPYAIIRHPRYVEILLIALGYAAVSNHVGPYVVAVLTFPLLHLVVLLEERELRDRFGDAYRDYSARVPRYIPRRGA